MLIVYGLSVLFLIVLLIWVVKEYSGCKMHSACPPPPYEPDIHETIELEDGSVFIYTTANGEHFNYEIKAKV